MRFHVVVLGTVLGLIAMTAMIITILVIQQAVRGFDPLGAVVVQAGLPALIFTVAIGMIGVMLAVVARER